MHYMKNASEDANKRGVYTFCIDFLFLSFFFSFLYTFFLDLFYTKNNSFTYLGGIFKNLQKILIIMLSWNWLCLIRQKTLEAQVLSTLPIYTVVKFDTFL